MLVTADRGRLVMERSGDGPVRVLALHGWGRTHDDWRGCFADVPTLAPDLPGFGLSPPPDTVWGSAEYAEQLEALVDEGPVVVVGHSFGGRVGVRLAARRPDLVRALVLTGAPLVRVTPPPKASRRFAAVKWLNRRGMISDEALERRRQASGSADYRAAEGVMRDILVRLLHETYTDSLDRLTVPVELVWGRHDTAATVDVASRLTELVPQARLTVVEGSGHLLDEPLRAALTDAVRRTLAEETL